MATRVISRDKILLEPASYIDPNGFVFSFDGIIYRAIYPAYAELFRRMLETGRLESLQTNHRLVRTVAADFVLDDQPDGLVLAHETIEPITYCPEWCPSMLADAALVTLDLALELAKDGLTLQDASPFNILFRGTEPVFVDVSSIIPASEQIIWPAYHQFQTSFTWPLILAEDGKGEVARSLLSDSINGIPLPTAYPLLSLKAKFSRPRVTMGYIAERTVQSRPSTQHYLKKFTSEISLSVSKDVRIRFLSALKGRISRPRHAPSGDPWANYYAGIDPSVDKKAKTSTVREVVSRLKPRRITDVGANTGIFSVIAAEMGARVIAVDSSETCCEQLYEIAKSGGHSITPVTANIITPTPHLGFAAREYPGLMERAQGDLVLCLGLMHHLHISGRQSFDRIASLLKDLSTKFVLFEYVAQNDANVALLNSARPVSYDRDNVWDTLKNHFRSVDAMPSDRPTRELFLCER